MSTFTPNINLEMPEPGEKFKLETWNGNLSLIDEVIANSGGTLTYTIAPYDCPEPYKSRADLILTEDGATNGAAINGMIDRANAERASSSIVAVIRFLSGNIVLDDANIKIPYNNIWFKGSNTRITTYFRGSSTVSITGANAWIDGLNILGSPPGGGAVHNKGPSLRISNCTLDGEESGPALFNDFYGCTVENSFLTSNDSFALHSSIGASAGMFRRCSFHANGNAYSAIYNHGYGCAFISCDISSVSHVHLIANTDSATNCLFENCRMDGTEASGFYNDASNCIFVNNYVFGANVNINSYGENTILMGNFCESTISVKSGTTKPATAAMLADLNVGTIVLT